MYESMAQKPLPHVTFLKRLLLHASLAFSLLVLSLGVGIAGYVHYEKLSFIDAFLNSAMLLGGMGPVNMPVTTGGKVFAGMYALYAGLVFIVSAALIFTPVLHRVLHKFHWNSKL